MEELSYGSCWHSMRDILSQVLFDACSSDLFLYNPLSNRHLKLPTVRNLEAIPEQNLELGIRCVNKVIISSSDPEGDLNCRALMIYGDNYNLAFCCPNSSNEWIETYQQCYADIVCATCDNNEMLFFGVHNMKWPYPEFEGWDLKDVSQPRLISLEDRLFKDFGKTFPWNKGYGRRTQEANFLVAAANNQQLYYVCLHGDDWYHKPKNDCHFDVHKFNFEKGKLVHMDRSLDGLAFFVGRNHSFALSASEFPQLKPNSIYFTHPKYNYEGKYAEPLGRQNIKIYDYENGTFSPLFYTVRSDIRDCVPMWFVPTADTV